GASASPSRGWPFNDFLRPTPRLEEPPGGEEKDSSDDGRRPTSCPSRRRGPRREHAGQPERSGGHPEGAGARAQRLDPLRSTRAASKRTGRACATSRLAAAWRTTHVARNGSVLEGSRWALWLVRSVASIGLRQR